MILPLMLSALLFSTVLFSTLLFSTVLLSTNLLAATLPTPTVGYVDLRKSQPISFPGISPTSYEISEHQIDARVAASASFLLIAFDEIRQVKAISFDWQTAGELKLRDAEHEASQAGDDARWRVGLLIHGPAPMMPLFAPSWLKTVRDVLKQTSDRMLYLIVDARHTPGTEWRSPHSTSVSNIAVRSEMNPDGWYHVHQEWRQPQAIAGLWIMADGDDTRSTFQSSLRSLILSE